MVGDKKVRRYFSRINYYEFAETSYLATAFNSISCETYGKIQKSLKVNTGNTIILTRFWLLILKTQEFLHSTLNHHPIISVGTKFWTKFSAFSLCFQFLFFCSIVILVRVYSKLKKNISPKYGSFKSDRMCWTFLIIVI